MLSRGNARVSTAEKVVMLYVTFCRFATMGVANSRFSDAAEFGNSAELRGVENSLSFSRICNLAEEKVGNLQFPPLKKVVLSRGNARVSTAEKVVMLYVTFCRFATMGVANSRLVMLPNSEIRQN